MNFFKFKNKNIVCFKKEELQNIFEVAKKAEFFDEIEKQKISLEDLRSDPDKMENLAKIVSDRTSNGRDDHEIFASIFVFADFYENGSEICFELKNTFNSSRDKIITLQDLNHVRNDPPDFIIKSSDGYREFELKRYRGGLTTNEVFDFLFKKIKHYGNNLGDMNLLLVLQSSGNDISKIDFYELNSKVKALNLKFEGWVLISYNESNKEMVINQVFPDLATTRIPMQLPSQR